MKCISGKNIVMIFYILNFFHDPILIFFCLDDLYHVNAARISGSDFVQSISVSIAIILKNIPDLGVKLIKMFFNEVFEIKMNGFPKNVILNVVLLVSFEKMYDILSESSIVDSLQIDSVDKII